MDTPTLTWRSLEDRDKWLDQEWPDRRLVSPNHPGFYRSRTHRGWRMQILLYNCWIWR